MPYWLVTLDSMIIFQGSVWLKCSSEESLAENQNNLFKLLVAVADLLVNYSSATSKV